MPGFTGYTCQRHTIARLSRLFVSSAIALSALSMGVVPSLRWHSSAPLSFDTVAIAQSISDDELSRYARSLLLIEPIRQAAYANIQRILGSDDVPAIACHRPNSLSALSANIRQIATNYCNQSLAIVERNNLTISRFNAITAELQDNPSLTTRIQTEMIRLQQR